MLNMFRFSSCVALVSLAHADLPAFTVQPVPRLQAPFLSIFDDSDAFPSWTGADCDTTFALSPNVTMFLFGDTLLCPHTRLQRTGPLSMPHSTMGVAASSSAGLNISFLVNGSGSMFIPPGPNPHGDYWWIMQAVSLSDTVSSETATVVILAARIRDSDTPGPLAFQTIATSVITATIPLGADGTPLTPVTDWSYTSCDLPTSGQDNVTWTTGIAQSESVFMPRRNETVYLFGSANIQSATPARQAVSLLRVSMADLMACNVLTPASSAEYLLTDATGDAVWSITPPTSPLDFYPVVPIALSESSIVWYAPWQVWLMPAITFLSNTVDLWYAPALEGPWVKSATPLLNIPAPWNSSKFFSYAPKLHPTLTADAGNALVWTFVSNAWNFTDLFEPGTTNVYIPQFYSMTPG